MVRVRLDVVLTVSDVCIVYPRPHTEGNRESEFDHEVLSTAGNIFTLHYRTHF
jgi:hypothetical protein